MATVHYHLSAFPPAELDWPQLIPLLGPASAAVARYDGTLAAIPNAAVLLSPLTTQEAVLSSRIEGTQATMGEVLEFEAEGGAPASSGIPAPTAKRMLPALRDAGVLRALVEPSGRRAATRCFPALLNIAEGREAF